MLLFLVKTNLGLMDHTLMLVKFKVGAFPVFFGKTSSRSKHSFLPSGLSMGSMVPLRAVFFGVYIWQSERCFFIWVVGFEDRVWVVYSDTKRCFIVFGFVGGLW